MISQKNDQNKKGRITNKKVGSQLKKKSGSEIKKQKLGQKLKKKLVTLNKTNVTLNRPIFKILKKFHKLVTMENLGNLLSQI